MGKKVKFHIPFYSVDAGYIIYNRKSNSPGWESIRQRAENEANANLLTSMSGITENFVNKSSQISQKLLEMGRQEEEKEKRLINRVLGTEDADLKDVKIFIEKFNEVLVGKKQFELAKKRLDEAIKLGQNKERKDRAPTIASFFVSYLEKTLSDNINKLVNRKPEEILSWNNRKLKEIVDNIISSSIEKAVENMFNAENKKGKEAYHGEWRELYEVYKRLENMPKSFEKMIRSKINMKGITNILKEQSKKKVSNEHVKGKKRGKNTKTLIREVINTKEHKHRTIGGSVEEYIESLKILKDIEIKIGENKTVISGGSAVIETEKAKADVITVFNFDTNISINMQKLVETFVEETLPSKGLIDAKNKIDNFYNDNLKYLDDIAIIYGSTKSYTMASSFNKFHGGGERKLSDAPIILSQLGVDYKKSNGFINALYNTMEGAIFHSNKESLRTAFKEQMTAALAYLLFDDWSTIGNVKNSPMAIHSFSLDGIELPLSVLLKAVGRAISSSLKEAENFFSVTLTIPKKGIWSDEIITAEKLGITEKEMKVTHVMQEWERQKQEALTKSTFSVNFLRNFKTIIKDYVQF